MAEGGRVLKTADRLEDSFEDNHFGTDDVLQGSRGKLGEDSHEGRVKQQKEKNLSIQTDIELHIAEHTWKPLHVTGRSKFIEEEEKREPGDILLGSRGKLGKESPRGSMIWQKEKNVSIQRDIKLHHADHPWKPSRLTDRSKLSEEEQKSEELCKKVRGILNKLTPQKFQTLVAKMQALPIDTETQLRTVIDMVFEKAINEPHFSVAYASMCRCLSMFKVPSDTKQGDVNFRALLLTKCQREFEKNNSSQKGFVVKREMSEKATMEDEKQKPMEEMEYQQWKAQMRSLGNIKFVGELFKQKMLSENVMHDCVLKLLRTRDKENMECVCRLLVIIGKVLDREKAKPRMDQYFTMMTRIINEKKLPPTVCFKIKDVIELRQNKWVPRRDESYPKTIDQIHQEVAQEKQNQALMLQKLPRFKVREISEIPLNGKTEGTINTAVDGGQSIQISNENKDPAEVLQTSKSTSDADTDDIKNKLGGMTLTEDKRKITSDNSSSEHAVALESKASLMKVNKNLTPSKKITSQSEDQPQCNQVRPKSPVSGALSKEACPVCLEEVTSSKTLRCGHTFCIKCIEIPFGIKPVCPKCGALHGTIYGDQPEGGKMKVYTLKFSLKGFEKSDTLRIEYQIPSGIQGPNHPKPGMWYTGIRRNAYLPDTTEGRKVCGLLKVAFKRRLVFTLGRSMTTGIDGVLMWNDIHHKTELTGVYGYPDPGYLKRVQENLAAKGVTEADFEQETAI